MKAGDVMTAGAATVSGDATIADAARLMLQHRLSGLPVVDAAGRLVGMITETDVLRRTEIGTERSRPGWVAMWLNPVMLAQEYVRARGRKVRELMTPRVVSIGPETPLEEVAEIMERTGYRRLPVVRDGQVVGIVSRANFLLALSRRLEEAPARPGDDLAIRKAIIDEIQSQSWNPLSMIDIEVHDGVVTLHGSVGDEPVRAAVLVAAENVPGVRKVEDNLRIVPFVPTYI